MSCKVIIQVFVVKDFWDATHYEVKTSTSLVFSSHVMTYPFCFVVFRVVLGVSSLRPHWDRQTASAWKLGGWKTTFLLWWLCTGVHVICREVYCCTSHCAIGSYPLFLLRNTVSELSLWDFEGQSYKSRWVISSCNNHPRKSCTYETTCADVQVIAHLLCATGHFSDLRLEC